MRRDVIGDITKAAGGIPVRHVVAGDDDPVELERNVLVVANETVISKELLDRIRERAAKGPASFLIVSPQESDVPSPEAARRLRRALSELRSEGIDAHGQVVHPDPFTAAMEATNDERVDEIIVSTFPHARSGWLRRDLVERLRAETGVPVDHVVCRSEAHGHERSRRAGRARAPPHGNANEHPPPIHYSSRIFPPIVGIFLFIGSEIMLFGSFFTVYFFDRVVNAQSHPGPWPPYMPGHAHPVRAAVVPGARQHVHPRHLELHDALGDDRRSSAATAPGSAPGWC